MNLRPLKPHILYDRAMNPMSPKPFSFSTFTLLLCILGFSGCLPSSCQREESRALFPADSLSRQIAEQIPVDTLNLVWKSAGPEALPLAYPRTVRFAPDASLYVSDAQQEAVYAFNIQGQVARYIQAESFTYPYIAGIRGDTLLVFNPEAGHIDFMVGERQVHRVFTPTELASRQRLQYTGSSADRIYFKTLGENFEGYIAVLNNNSQTVQRISLEGPLWRHAGLIRTWGPDVVSLSAYRPILDLLEADGSRDSLTLIGFDSPMLARSRSFILGNTRQPPLLTSSAAPTDDLLFVLNLRPGWLRVDAYNREGRLQHRLVQDDPSFNQSYYPIDIDVRITQDSSYHMAILVVEPDPHLALYTWKP